MANPATSVDMPGVVHLHDTTAIDRELGSGLSLTTVPAAGFAAGPPDSSEDMAARLGLDVVESYEPTDEAVLAILAGIVDATDAETGLARIRELMRGLPGHPLAGVEPRTREFVEHCAFAPIIAVEESLLSQSADSDGHCSRLDLRRHCRSGGCSCSSRGRDRGGYCPRGSGVGASRHCDRPTSG